MTIIRKDFAAVCEIAPKRDPRKMLNGVCVQQRDGHVRLVATDGKRGIILRYNDAAAKEQPEVVIPTKEWKSAFARVAGASEELCFVDFEAQGNGRIVATAKDARVEFPAIEGKYPNVDSVIPNESEYDVTKVHVNPAILGSLLTALSKLGTDAVTIKMLTGKTDADKQMVTIEPVSGHGANEWKALCMPLRIHEYADAADDSDESVVPF